MALKPSKVLLTPSSVRMNCFGDMLDMLIPRSLEFTLQRATDFRWPRIGAETPSQAAQLIRQTHNSLRHEKHDENEHAAQDVEPLLGEGARRVTLQAVDGHSADNRPHQRTAPAHRAPYDRFERLLRRHFAGIDNPDLRNVQRATQSRNDGGGHKNEELETGRGITRKEHPIFAVADGALNEPELRRREPATKQV